MWFRNARVFRFTKPFDITTDELEEKLQADTFKPCGLKKPPAKAGWLRWANTVKHWCTAPTATT